MQVTPNKVLMRRNKRRQVHYRIRRKMMQLCSKEVQKSAEKRMWRHQKASADIRDEEDSLVLMRSRFSIARLRQPPSRLRNEAIGDELEHLLLGHLRQDPIALHPPRRRGEAQSRALPCLLLFLQLGGSILSHLCKWLRG